MHHGDSMSDSGAPAGSFDNWAFPPQPPSWPQPPVQPPKRTARPLTLVAAIVATVLIGAMGGVAVAFATRSQPTPAPGSSLTPNPGSPIASQASALYQRVLTITRGAAGFEYVSVSTGAQSETIAGVAGQAAGRQVITFNSSYGSESFTLLLSGATVYFQGNTPAIEDQIGVSAANAPKLAGKWVSVVSRDGPYSVLQPGITVGDQAQEMPLVPTSVARLTTAAGLPATRILGTIPAQPGAAAQTAHLDATTSSGIPLSYATSFRLGNGTTASTTTTYSQWGTAPSVSVPAAAVAWSTLATTTPPGGYGSGGTSAASPSATAQPAI
jgi:hypothetical protein